MADEQILDPTQDQNPEGANGGTGTEPTEPTGTGAAPVDYDRIQQMLDGVLNAKENTALKAYFKQQGLSQEDVEKAIADFKANQQAKKDAQAPDVDGLNETINGLNAEIATLKEQNAALIAERANDRINAATMALADELNFESKNYAYILKSIDTSDIVNEEGIVDTEKLKSAITKFLDDVPNFKKSTTLNNRSFNIGSVGAGKNDSGNANKAKPTTARGMIDAIFT